MSQRSLRGYVFLGVRLVCTSAFLGMSYCEYRQHGYRAALSFLTIFVVVTCLTYSTWQGRKLADLNMRRHGLNPDREEGPFGS